MLTAWLIGLVLAAIVIAFHYEVLRLLAGHVWHLSRNRRRRTVLTVMLLFAAHVADIWLFAAGFYPFIPGAILKLALAAAILPSLWSFLGKK